VFVCSLLAVTRARLFPRNLSARFVVCCPHHSRAPTMKPIVTTTGKLAQLR
jgi:hypothetical protein